MDERDQMQPAGQTVRFEYKHSLAVRWMHWLNFPLLALMIYSGMVIYWADSRHEGLNAHQVYRVGFGGWTVFRLFPPWFYNILHLKFQLAKGRAYHFFFMWFFPLNGCVYVLYTIFWGEWRDLVPNRRSFTEAIQVIQHDLGFRRIHLPRCKFNGAQKIGLHRCDFDGRGFVIHRVCHLQANSAPLDHGCSRRV